jgi:hypothetical protein
VIVSVVVGLDLEGFGRIHPFVEGPSEGSSTGHRRGREHRGGCDSMCYRIMDHVAFDREYILWIAGPMRARRLSLACVSIC